MRRFRTFGRRVLTRTSSSKSFVRCIVNVRRCIRTFLVDNVGQDSTAWVATSFLYYRFQFTIEAPFLILRVHGRQHIDSSAKTVHRGPIPGFFTMLLHFLFVTFVRTVRDRRSEPTFMRSFVRMATFSVFWVREDAPYGVV